MALRACPCSVLQGEDGQGTALCTHGHGSTGFKGAHLNMITPATETQMLAPNQVPYASWCAKPARLAGASADAPAVASTAAETAPTLTCGNMQLIRLCSCMNAAVLGGRQELNQPIKLGQAPVQMRPLWPALLRILRPLSPVATWGWSVPYTTLQT